MIYCVWWKRRRDIMALRYKMNVLKELKDKGYSSARIREEKLLGQSYLQQLRHQKLVSWGAIDVLCKLLDCQVGDIVEYYEEKQTETPS